MSAIDEILRTRGKVPNTAARQTDQYQGMIESGGHPQMGFTLKQAHGPVDGFLYHNLDNLEIRQIGEAEYLSFTHRGKAVTLQGQYLETILLAIMNHTLIRLVQYDGEAPLPAERTPLITRVAVSLVPMAAENNTSGNHARMEEMVAK